MSIPSPILTFTGQALDEAIETVSEERKPIAENFIYEKSAIMLYADDGVGKSVLALQTGMQTTVAGSKVFGEFFVPEARNVLYFQMERHIDESFERIKHLSRQIPFDSKRFALSVALQGINLQEAASRCDATGIFETVVSNIGFIPHIIFFDPIYAMVVDGLETANACNSITGFFRVIQSKTSSTIFATSHTNRGIKKSSGQRVGKDLYGNRFLSAFFTGSYHITQKANSTGTLFKLDKNSQRNLEKEFGLNYDASCYRSWIDNENNLSKKDRLDNFLKTCKITNREFSFSDMQSISDLSDSALRGYLSGYLKSSINISATLSRGKLLYKFTG